MRSSLLPGFGVALLLSSLSSGCYNEGLNIHNLAGHVVVPRAAATQTLPDPITGVDREVTDVALIGPVYVGLYPNLDLTLDDYPLPKVGPDGVSHPYSGSTIGDYRYACFEFFTCKLVSGRFASYDDVLTWYKDVIGDPVVDAAGNEVLNGQTIQQTCFDLLEVTSDEEIRVLAGDRTGDGAIDAADLDFVEDENGDFVGTFEIPQADFYSGMKAWAFMDTPVFFQTQEPGKPLRTSQGQYGTCLPSIGYGENTYDRNFQAGNHHPSVLNAPGSFLNEGDRVACQSFEWTEPEADAELVLDFVVGTDSTFDAGRDCK